MIEMHCHILPNIDDGVRSFEESIEIIKKLENLGYEKIIITPHYINGTSYNKNNEEKNKLFLELQKKLLENNINIEMYLGNEIFLDENIIEDLKINKCSALNSSKYVLIEVSRDNTLNNFNEIIYNLINNGYIPILAHPERYMCVKRNKNILKKWISMGVLLQINFESISGKYGLYAKKNVKFILKNNLATFIGGDIHKSSSTFFDNYWKNKKKIIKIIGEEKYEKLTNKNILNIINNKETY